MVVKKETRKVTGIKLYDKERDFIKAMGAKLGGNMSTYVRSLIIKEMEKKA